MFPAHHVEFLKEKFKLIDFNSFEMKRLTRLSYNLVLPMRKKTFFPLSFLFKY